MNDLESLKKQFEDKLGESFQHLIYKDHNGDYALESIFCAFEGFKLALGFEENET